MSVYEASTPKEIFHRGSGKKKQGGKKKKRNTILNIITDTILTIMLQMWYNTLLNIQIGKTEELNALIYLRSGEMSHHYLISNSILNAKFH